MVFLDQCNKNIKREAEIFIEEIKSGEISKRKIYEGDFSQSNEKRYLESFKSLSKKMENIMNDYYNKISSEVL